MPGRRRSPGRRSRTIFWRGSGDVCNNQRMATGRDRRRFERVPTASIPVQLSDINGELIDLSMDGAAVIHRSPVKSGSACTLIFPSHGGFYIPCQVLRSVVQVRRSDKGSEYVFRSAILFNPIPAEQQE